MSSVDVWQGRLPRSIAARSPTVWLMLSCSVTNAVLLPAPHQARADGSKLPKVERCSWMRSAIFRSFSRSSSCAFSKKERSCALAHAKPFLLMFGWSRQPTSIWKLLCAQDGSEKISTFVSTWPRCAFLRCESDQATSCPWPSISLESMGNEQGSTKLPLAATLYSNCSTILGQAMFASWKTSSTGPC